MILHSTMRYKTLIFVLFLAFMAGNLSAQNNKAVKEIQNAKEAIGNNDMPRAWQHISKALKYDPNYVDALLMAGDYKMYEEKPAEGIPYYEKALGTSGKTFIKYKLALAYRDVLRYDDGLNLLREYETERQIPADKQAEFNLLMASMAFGAEAVKTPVPFNPQDLGSGVNTVAIEYFPSINARGDVLVITRRMTTGDKQDEDFYASTLGENGWKEMERLDGFLNTSDNEGAQSLSADGTELYFTGCHRQDGFGSCDIYVSFYRNGLWMTPVNLGQNVNSGSWDSQPSISPDGKTLYFVRGKSGYTTNTSIMESNRNPDGTWSRAKPIEGPINTDFADEAPFIHFDNQTLYFTSDGHPGMGRKDLFYSKKKPDGTWGEPVNLGYPINSPYNEFSLVVGPDGETGYFSSNRAKGGEDLDVFSFQLPAESRATAITWVLGKVTNVETGRAVKSVIDFHDLNSNTDFQQIETDEAGNFFAVMPVDKNFAVFVNQKGYLPFSENYDLSGIDKESNYELNIGLVPIKPGTKFTLSNILFDTDSYNLKPESEAELSRLVVFLKENGTLHAELGGHTDNEGSAAHNKTLSENRAKAVVTYLVQHGIDQKRLTSKGFGDTQPVADNATEKGRKENRRTEVILK